MEDIELIWHMVCFSSAVIAWGIAVFLVIRFVTLRQTHSSYRNLMSSGLLICLCTAITAPYLNYCSSSFLLHLAKSQRDNSLLIEKFQNETSEQKSHKSWLKTVDSLDAPLLYQGVKLHLSAMVEPLYLIITIVGSGLGSTFLAMAVIEKLPRNNRPYSESYTSYAYSEYKTKHSEQFKNGIR